MSPSEKEVVSDQATGLRNIGNNVPRVIAVTSGKGGVGKTNVSVNLALAMANKGKRVMLLDADFGLANVDLLLGIKTRINLSHVISGERLLEEVIVDGPSSLKIIPGGSGIKKMADMNYRELAGLVNVFNELSHGLDVFVVDTAAGISDSVIRCVQASQDVVVVVSDEPASLTDAYALIKVVNQEFGRNRFSVLANMARSPQQGQEIYTSLVKVTDRFLDVALEYLGYIPYDDYLRKAVKKRRAVMESYPGSESAKAFGRLAERIEKWPRASKPSGELQFFFERFVSLTREENAASV